MHDKPLNNKLLNNPVYRSYRFSLDNNSTNENQTLEQGLPAGNNERSLFDAGRGLDSNSTNENQTLEQGQTTGNNNQPSLFGAGRNLDSNFNSGSQTVEQRQPAGNGVDNSDSVSSTTTSSNKASKVDLNNANQNKFHAEGIAYVDMTQRENSSFKKLLEEKEYKDLVTIGSTLKVFSHENRETKLWFFYSSYSPAAVNYSLDRNRINKFMLFDDAFDVTSEEKIKAVNRMLDNNLVSLVVVDSSTQRGRIIESTLSEHINIVDINNNNKAELDKQICEAFTSHDPSIVKSSWKDRTFATIELRAKLKTVS